MEWAGGMGYAWHKILCTMPLLDFTFMVKLLFLVKSQLCCMQLNSLSSLCNVI